MKNAAGRADAGCARLCVGARQSWNKGPCGKPHWGKSEKMGHVWELGLKNVVSDQV